MSDILPGALFRFPRVSPLWDDEDDWGLTTNMPNGISISEDETHVFVEVAVPGLNPEEIEVTFDKGVLWIKGESKEVEEDKKRKYYRKASASFSYRVVVPGDIDLSIEPHAQTKNGMMKVTFTKSKQSQPKKIMVRS